MFDIGWTEILVIGVVAIVVFPSKDLPKLLRTTGQMVGRVRRMAGDFQSQFNAALREAEREVDLADTRKQVEDLKRLNPLNDVRKAKNPLKAAGDEVRKSLTDASKPASSAPSQFVPPPPAVKPPDGPPTIGAANPTLEPAPAPTPLPATQAETPASTAKPTKIPKPAPSKSAKAEAKPVEAPKAKTTRARKPAAAEADAPPRPARTRKTKTTPPEGGSA